jgi:hypothetical protein
MDILLSIVPMMITIPVTAVLCRYRISRKKRVSYGTVFLGVFIAAFLWFAFVSDGDCFSPGFLASITSRVWTRVGDGRVLLLKFVAFNAVASVLSAMGAVHYYQKRSKKIVRAKSQSQ